MASRFMIDEKGRLLFIRTIDKPADPPRPVLNEVAEAATEAHITAHKDLYDRFVNEQASSASPQVAKPVKSAGKITTGTLSGANRAAQDSNEQEDAATERALRDIKGKKGSSGAKKAVEDQRQADEQAGRAHAEQDRQQQVAGESYIDHQSQQRVRGVNPDKPAAHSASGEPGVSQQVQNKGGKQRVVVEGELEQKQNKQVGEQSNDDKPAKGKKKSAKKSKR